MSKKLGFIGCGNMGKAMIHGVLASGKAQASDILASAKTESSREKNAAELGIRLTADNKSVAEFADILFLAVKPQYYEEVIAEIKVTCIKRLQSNASRLRSQKRQHQKPHGRQTHPYSVRTTESKRRSLETGRHRL